MKKLLTIFAAIFLISSFAFADRMVRPGQFTVSGTSLVAVDDTVLDFCLFDGTTCTDPSVSGDVSGPGSAVDNNLAAFDSTTGKLIKDSGLLTANILTTSSTVSALTEVGTLTVGNADAIVSAASVTVAGKIEIATSAETTTGTDATRAVSPDGLAGSDYGTSAIQVVLLDDTTDTAIADGVGDITIRIPDKLDGYNLIGISCNVLVAGTTNTTDIQINNVTQAADMLSTKCTIDSAETEGSTDSSSTAATPPVIDTANDDVAVGDQIRFDVDAVSTTAAKGLQISLYFQLP